jgi:hypothetical protein
VEFKIFVASFHERVLRRNQATGVLPHSKTGVCLVAEFVRILVNPHSNLLQTGVIRPIGPISVAARNSFDVNE